MSPNLTRLGLDKATLIGMSAILMWSSSIGVYRNIAEIFGPVGGAALTFTVSGLAAVIYAGRSALRGHSVNYLLLGGFFFVAYEVCLSLALGFADNRSQSIELGLINYLWPCLTIVLAVLLGDQRANFVIVPGVLLSLLGIFWVTSGGESVGLQPLLANIGKNPVAYALALAAAITWPIYTLATRRMANGRNAVPLFLLGTAAVLWIKFFMTEQPPLHFELEGALLVGGFGVITTLAYSAWNHGVMHGNLTLLASASYFTPVLSVLLSSLLFQVMPLASFWIGALMVTGGSLMCWWAVRASSKS
ncbi:aromatic amino acid DMT transporter YddG [Pseudomonas sp. TTU2014-080ASC]|uniref:aromatic amino acid DMT transporter YddG n=1 Tax=Pseudomonas sp. TTU2014-080ASC TaxID=1729724 RepID=UPI0007187943|nr:aromatic amino acid DMT transporter YddG [Pseudomonas sp. TTU2014-080ASC]KRW58458.1 hypothetical protein AO726_16575 [Pseudomonas sp. TTU2014-080ASC]